MKFPLYIFLFLVISLAGCQSSNEIYLVRHAEKSTTPANDPPLTDKGKVRSESLKDLLKGKNIKAIFSTQTKRTRETATPLGMLITIPIQSYSNDTAIAFMQSVIGLKKNVLIVGHSNTLLPMLDALHLSHSITSIPDAVHNNIFIIKTKNGKAVKVTETTYETISATAK